MDVYAAIDGRRTLRDFDGRAVPGWIVEKLIGAGLKAPTNDHMRQWEFVVVDDRAQREKLLRPVDPFEDSGEIDALLDGWGMTDKTQRDMYQHAVPRQHSMLLNAGCLILPFFKTDAPLLQPESLSSLNVFASIWCCIENILLAAASEGLFGVTRIPMTAESAHIRNVLGHPEKYVMPCYIALGYPADGAQRTKQNAVSAKTKMHFNVW